MEMESFIMLHPAVQIAIIIMVGLAFIALVGRRH